MPHSGELREEVVIKSPTEVQSGTGGTSVNWSSATVVATARAKVEPLRGDEQQQAGIGENATAEYRIWIRWRTGVTTKQRIFWRSLELDIVSAQNLRYRNEWLEILANEHRTA